MNPLSLAGTPLEYFHVCAFFNSKDEEYEVLLPFFKESLDQGEKSVHIVAPAFVEEHKARMVSGGVQAHHCVACGQLEVLGWDQAYLDETGTFNKDRMLATVDAITATGAAAGFSCVRIVGDMGWAFDDRHGTEKLIEYEAEVHEVLSRNRQPAVCVYDISRLDGTTMMDLLRTHPLTLIGGTVQENPFYTTPAKMLEQLRARKAAAQASH